MPRLRTRVGMGHRANKEQHGVLRVLKLLHEVFEVYMATFRRKCCGGTITKGKAAPGDPLLNALR